MDKFTQLKDLIAGNTELLQPLLGIVVEYSRAVAKHPIWPTDPVHATVILLEEAGELTQATLQVVYEGAGAQGVVNMYNEATQTGAMALRFLANMEDYRLSV